MAGRRRAAAGGFAHLQVFTFFSVFHFKGEPADNEALTWYTRLRRERVRVHAHTKR